MILWYGFVTLKVIFQTDLSHHGNGSSSSNGQSTVQRPAVPQPWDLFAQVELKRALGQLTPEGVDPIDPIPSSVSGYVIGEGITTGWNSGKC